MRVSHLTPVLAVLLAAAWRWRDSKALPAFCRLRDRRQVLRVAARRLASGTGVARSCSRGAGRRARRSYSCCRSRRSHDYADALSRVREVFEHESYNIFGLMVQAGASDSVAHAGSVVVGLVLLAGVWRYQSFALAVGTALVLSPISWLDYSRSRRCHSPSCVPDCPRSGSFLC